MHLALAQANFLTEYIQPLGAHKSSGTQLNHPIVLAYIVETLYALARALKEVNSAR